jgi:NADH-quinone oxidoreductase subunit L
MIAAACLIPLLPLAAFAVNILCGRFVRTKAAWISIVASLISCALAFPLILAVIRHGDSSAGWPWINLGPSFLSFGFLLDPLSATLLFVVTVVGTLIQIYSVGYMHDDPRYSRFFAYLSLFMFSMLAVVIANNFILFFIGWEIMGLCSYLLIGFWFEKNSAANAGLKAFLTTRVGDVGFFLGILTLFAVIGTLNFSDLPSAVAAKSASPLLPIAALLIFCGTIGKSAQFPLHVWLPDAMEGPTPVSALIHAATMVAAGVYLVARSFALFSAFPVVMDIVTFIGLGTAIMAAFMALTVFDIKRVLAYSTISQLGYMITALGLGGLSAGIFHLMTHAFFKALLFLAAGSVIHGTGTQDIRELGGLFGKMKSTSWTFLIASLALAGVPPLSGFWSKDEILVNAFESRHFFIFPLLLLTVFMTAFYIFRLVFLTFFGKARKHEIHAHESPAIMTVPLWLLAIGSILMGLPGSPLTDHWLQVFLHGPHPAEAHVLNVLVMSLGAGIALTGIAVAATFYLLKPEWPVVIAKVFRPLYLLSFNKFWIDEFYMAYVVRPFQALAQSLFRFDLSVIDGAVNATGIGMLKSSSIHNWIDKYIVDGLVNFVGSFTQFLSSVVRRIQTGFIQNYLLIVFLVVLVLMYFELK